MNLFMYVCMHVFMYVCMYVHMSSGVGNDSEKRLTAGALDDVMKITD